MLRCSVYHGKKNTDFEDYFQWFNQLPKNVKARFDDNWQYVGQIYVASFAQAKCAFVYSSARSDKGHFVGLSDNWITYKWKTGSKIWLEFDTIVEAVDTWNKVINKNGDIPIYKTIHHNPLLAAKVKVNKEFSYTIKGSTDYNDVYDKDGNLVFGDTEITLPLDTVYKVERVSETEPWKLRLIHDGESKSAAYNLGYRQYNVVDEPDIWYCYFGCDIRDITEIVEPSSIAKGFDISKYDYRPEDLKYYKLVCYKDGKWQLADSNKLGDSPRIKYIKDKADFDSHIEASMKFGCYSDIELARAAFAKSNIIDDGISDRVKVWRL